MNWVTNSWQVHVEGELYSVYLTGDEWTASRVYPVAGMHMHEPLGTHQTLAQAMVACESRRAAVLAQQGEQVEAGRPFEVAL